MIPLWKLASFAVMRKRVTEAKEKVKGKVREKIAKVSEKVEPLRPWWRFLYLIGHVASVVSCIAGFLFVGWLIWKCYLHFETRSLPFALGWLIFTFAVGWALIGVCTTMIRVSTPRVWREWFHGFPICGEAYTDASTRWKRWQAEQAVRVEEQKSDIRQRRELARESEKADD